MILLGELALWVALLMAAWGAAASFAGGTLQHPPLVRSGERAAYVTLASLALAVTGLLAALVKSDFSLAYVASVTSANLPSVYKLSALWAGVAGARLLWACLLCACAVAALVAAGARRRGAAPLATAALLALVFAPLLATCFGANPYARLDWLPPEGRGLAPPLQHPGAAIFPPTLALGYAAGTVPLAQLLASESPSGSRVFGSVRRWALASWLCLTTGLLLAAWSAYAEVGAGAYSSWHAHPASVAPWLLTTVYLHRADGGRAAPSRWRAALAVATGVLCAGAGLLPPRAAGGTAAGSGGSALWSAAMLLAAGGVSAYVLATRRHREPDAAAELPKVRARRVYGGHVVHAGVALLAAGTVGLLFRQNHEATLHPGVRYETTDPFGRRWAFVSQGVSSEQVGNRDATVVAVEARRAGARAGYLRGEQRRHFDSRGALIGAPTPEVGLLGSFAQDVRAVLVGVGADESARFRISFIPLARWMWIGGAVMVLGAAIALLTPAPSEEMSA